MRLISADALAEQVENEYKFAQNGARQAYSRVLDLIASAPTIQQTNAKDKKTKVVLQGYIQTGEHSFSNVYKTIDVVVPYDGMEWFVVGEMRD